MEIETSEQLAFIPEQVESIMMGVIDGVLKTEVYEEEKVGHEAPAESTKREYALKRFSIKILQCCALETFPNLSTNHEISSIATFVFRWRDGRELKV